MNLCKNMAWRILSRRWHLIWPRWSLHWSGLGQFACYSAPTLIRQNPICAFYARLMDPENISLVPDNPTTWQYCGRGQKFWTIFFSENFWAIILRPTFWKYNVGAQILGLKILWSERARLSENVTYHWTLIWKVSAYCHLLHHCRQHHNHYQHYIEASLSTKTP